MLWAIVSLASAIIPSKKAQHKIFLACVNLLETVSDTPFNMLFSIAEKYEPPLTKDVLFDGKENDYVKDLLMLKGAADFDWETAHSIIYSNKDFEDYKGTLSGMTPDQVAQNLERMKKINWRRYYTSFGKNNDYSF